MAAAKNPEPRKNSPVLEETRIHGTFTFPCTMYFAREADKGDPPFVLKPHWHDSVEILHLVKGDYQCGFNMTSMHITQEAFCFLESGSLHSMQSPSPYEEEAVVFDPGLLLGAGTDEGTRQILDPLRSGSLRLPLLIQEGHSAFPRIQDTFLRLKATFMTYARRQQDQHLVQNPAGQLRIKAALLELFAILYEENELFTQEKETDPRLESLKQVMLYIRDNYRDKITLGDLALIMNMNEQYFCRFFKKALGKSPITYIKEMRIKEAALLLAGTQESVSTIAKSCGFTNLGHFQTEFKKAMGKTPAQYRKGQEIPGL